MSVFIPIFEWSLRYTDGRRITGRKEMEPVEGPATAYTVKVIADLPEGEVKSLRGRIRIDLPKDALVFMDGYQSWTDCEELPRDVFLRGLTGTPQAGITRFSLDRYADYHFMQYPNRRGVHFGYSFGHFRLNDGTVAMFGSRDEEGGYSVFLFRNDKEKLYCSKDMAGIRIGGPTTLYDLYIAEGTEDDAYDGYFASAGIRALPAKKIAGYSSWYNRYQDIDHTAIAGDLAGAKKVLSKGDLFQIDDGWEPFVGDWLQPDMMKFPHGMKAEVEAIHEAGFVAGLWLSPFIAETKSAIFRDHPDWFLLVPDRGHELVAYADYILPPYGERTGIPWQCGINWSGYYALDIDHPDVLQYLAEVFATVREWGFDLVKLDFLYGAAPFGTKEETRAARMIRAMNLLRVWCGDMKILGCGVPLFPAFGRVEYCRVSCDVTLDWNDKRYMQIIHRERPSTRNAIRTDRARAVLDGRAFGNDPDVFFLRTENMSLTQEEKEALIRTAIDAGSVFLTSDDMSQYDEAQIARYREIRKEFEAASLR